MSHLRTDLRSALRRLRLEPGSSLAIVATLGLGIGIVTLFFNAFDVMVLRPFPFVEAHRLVHVTEMQQRTQRRLYGVSAERFLDLRLAGVSELAGLEAYDYEDFNLHAAEAPERVQGSRVTAGLFPLLGSQPSIGRLFTEAEDRSDAAVVLLGDSLWRRSFAADAGIVGRSVRIDGRERVVIGVMPRDFAFPLWQQVWLPAGLTPASAEGRRVQVLGRLAPGASPESAQQAMAAIVGRPEAPGRNTEVGLRVLWLRDEWLPPITRTAALIMLGFAALVLLIVHANLVHLVLASAEARRQQTAIARALGASQGRLLAQSAVESLVVVIPAGFLGLLLAHRASLGFHRLSAIPLPYWLRFPLTPRALAVGLIVAFGSSLLLGAIAAGAGFRSPLGPALVGGRSAGGREGSRLRRGLVMAQYGFAAFVLVGALLMWRSYEGLARHTPGFEVDERVTLRAALSSGAYSEVASRLDYLRRARERLATLPEVASVAVVSRLPISRGGWDATGVTTSRGEKKEEAPLAALEAVSESYFATLGISLVAGRGFTAGEVEGGRPVAVVSSSLARRLWKSGGAVGRRLRTSEGEGTWLSVVGVAADVEPGEALAGLERAPAHQLYVPLAIRFGNGESPLGSTPALVLATAAAPESLAARLRHELAAVDPEVPIFDIQTMRRTLQQFYFAQYLWSRMFAAIAAAALLIAAVGAYGVSAYAVGRRTRELGIRMALGAAPRRLLGSVLGQGLVFAGSGLALGLLAAIPLAVAMARLLHHVELTQPAVLGGAIALLGLAALLATWAPALRASTVDPTESLRDG